MLRDARRQGARNAFRLPLPRAPVAGRPGSRARDARTQAYDAPEVSRDRRMAAEKSNPARHFGREVRRARLAARMTLAEFGRAIGYDPGQISRVERGVRPPTEKFAQMCDKAFPERDDGFSASTKRVGSGLLPRHGSVTGSSTSNERSNCKSGSRPPCPDCCKPRHTRVRSCGHSPAPPTRKFQSVWPRGWHARRS
jgi:hypothetical protein